MPVDNEEALEAYSKDSRIACQYGTKCYQKNPAHHTKYKHPPTGPQKKFPHKNATNGRKRKNNSDDGPQSRAPDSKLKKDDSAQPADLHRLSQSPSTSSDDEEVVNPNIIKETSDEESEDQTSDLETSQKLEKQKLNDSSENSAEDKNSEKSPETSRVEGNNLQDEEVSRNNSDISSSEFADEKKLISELFLVEMPEDFYKFYKFCVSLSSKDPLSALKPVNLELVGPFDVLSGKIRETPQDDKEKYLRHWRYFYDPPEFQTVLKGNEKDGLHYGYWRDDVNEKPAFVAKNLACKDCKITKMGPNIFCAALTHTEEVLKRASPFEKFKVMKILQKLKSFAKDENISLDKISADMKLRERNMVTKTFHGAGIVVKYDKKTQLGYRSLAVTDNQFLKILKKIDEATSDKERIENMTTVEEVVRMATIAADECDFGTPLELGHDLFSCGINSLQKTALRMLVMSYSLLQRPQFSEIAKAHLKDRKKGSDLSVIE